MLGSDYRVTLKHAKTTSNISFVIIDSNFAYSPFVGKMLLKRKTLLGVGEQSANMPLDVMCIHYSFKIKALCRPVVYVMTADYLASST